MKDDNPQKEHRWIPNQRMPLEFFVKKGIFSAVTSQGLSKKMTKDQVLKMAQDAELLAIELREAADLLS